MTANVGVPQDITLTNGLNSGRFPALNNETCFNLFEFDGAMIPTAGFTSILPTVGGENTESRGIFYSDILSQCVVVVDDKLIAVTPTSHRTLGTLKTERGKVFLLKMG